MRAQRSPFILLKGHVMKKTGILLPLGAVAALSALAGYGVYRYFWTPPLPKADPNRKHIICIGDSITFGAGVAKKRSTQSYPAVLNQLVSEEWQVLNYGLSGRTLLDEADTPYRKEKYYYQSLRERADIYIIMLGTNDSKPYNWEGNKALYQDELVEMIRGYQYLPNKPEVVVLQPPKCFPKAENEAIVYDISDDVVRDGVNPAVKRAAEICGVKCLDLYRLTENHPEYFQDGVHPNALGNQKIAAYLFENIQPLL